MSTRLALAFVSLSTLLLGNSSLAQLPDDRPFRCDNLPFFSKEEPDWYVGYIGRIQDIDRASRYTGYVLFVPEIRDDDKCVPVITHLLRSRLTTDAQSRTPYYDLTLYAGTFVAVRLLPETELGILATDDTQHMGVVEQIRTLDTSTAAAYRKKFAIDLSRDGKHARAHEATAYLHPRKGVRSARQERQLKNDQAQWQARIQQTVEQLEIDMHELKEEVAANRLQISRLRNELEENRQKLTNLSLFTQTIMFDGVVKTLRELRSNALTAGSAGDLLLTMILLGQRVSLLELRHRLLIQAAKRQDDWPLDKILASAVHVQTATRRGSGSVINVDRFLTTAGHAAIEADPAKSTYFVSTAWHVVEKAFSADGTLLANQRVEVVLRDPQSKIFGSTGNSYTTKLVAHDPRIDVAILAFTTDKTKEYETIEVATRDLIDGLATGREIYLIASPAGLDPAPYPGTITDRHHETGTLDVLITSAPATGGSSGGDFVAKDEYSGRVYLTSVLTRGYYDTFVANRINITGATEAIAPDRLLDFVEKTFQDEARLRRLFQGSGSTTSDPIVTSFGVLR